ncbi:MAG: hypothetical protein NW207_03470, partial [Cytophagales bacterium]|nr:hypothetical protein [Cytophagales bacterium]
GIISPSYKMHVVESNGIPNYAPAWITFTSSATSGGNTGINIDVTGNAASGTAVIYGAYAKATAANFANYATGVYGEAAYTGGTTSALTGVWGETVSAHGGSNYGIYGRAYGSTLANYGVTGIVSNTGGTNNYGGYFESNSSGTTNYGLFVTVAGTATNKYAAFFGGGGVGIGTVPGTNTTLHLAATGGANIKLQALAEVTALNGVISGIDFLDAHTNTPQASILVRRDEAGGPGDLPTGILFNVVTDGSAGPVNTAAKVANNRSFYINTTTGTPNSKLHIRDGHIQVSQPTAPTAAPGAGAGAGATCTLLNANDIAGKINLTTGTGPVAGVGCTITFNRAYGVAPIVIITPLNGTAGQTIQTERIYTSSTTTTFTINYGTGATITASTLHQYQYFVIETQ